MEVKFFIYGEFENEQKKDKKILTFLSRNSNSWFLVFFQPMIWVFMEGEVTRSNQNKQLNEIDFNTLRPEGSENIILGS